MQYAGEVSKDVIKDNTKSSMMAKALGKGGDGPATTITCITPPYIMEKCKLYIHPLPLPSYFSYDIIDALACILHLVSWHMQLTSSLHPSTF